MKKILVFPVRNEDWILERTLACASLWADYIILANHNSTDTTLDIARKFPKVLVIENTQEFHSSTIRKTLLEKAREIPGNNCIFSFDADEIPTGHILAENFWDEVRTLTPGTIIELEWTNLWRSPNQYRTDGVQAPQWKAFGFVDDRVQTYETLGVINDHTSRVPEGTRVSVTQFQYPKVLHYQFVGWERMLSKQAHYRMVEWIQKKRTWVTALKINLKYYSTKDERGLSTAPVPSEWMRAYTLHGLDPAAPFPQSAGTWHDDAVLHYFKTYGPPFFAKLDIWDVDWQRTAAASDTGMFAGLTSFYPSRLLNFVFTYILPILAYRNWFIKLAALARPSKI